jgi:hypothetical protein
MASQIIACIKGMSSEVAALTVIGMVSIVSTSVNMNLLLYITTVSAQEVGTPSVQQGYQIFVSTLIIMSHKVPNPPKIAARPR